MDEDQKHQADSTVEQDAKEDWSRVERVVSWRAEAVRKILVAVIALLIFREVVSCLANLLGVVPALISGIIVFAIQLFCSRLAKANLRYYGYMLVPTLLFTVLPIALKLRELSNFRNAAPIARFWIVAPTIVSFVLPMILLLIAYWIIGRQIPWERRYP
jgi:hypothetical protein